MSVFLDRRDFETISPGLKTILRLKILSILAKLPKYFEGEITYIEKVLQQEVGSFFDRECSFKTCLWPGL